MGSTERARAVREIMARLRSIRAETAQEAVKTSRQAQHFETLHDLTKEQEAEADAVNDQLDTLEIELDAIDCALLSLACFGTK